MRLSRAQRLAALRLVLSAVGVLAGLTLPMFWLRNFHVDAISSLLHATGVSTHRTGHFIFTVNATPIEVTNVCTSIEVAFAALPLIYRSQWRVKWSLPLLAVAIALFEALNIARLYLGLFLYAHGLSWNVTHVIPSGVFYFLILYPVLRVGGWVQRDPVKYMVLSLPDSPKGT
jgi:hypothetical protein